MTNRSRDEFKTPVVGVDSRSRSSSTLEGWNDGEIRKIVLSTMAG